MACTRDRMGAAERRSERLPSDRAARTERTACACKDGEWSPDALGPRADTSLASLPTLDPWLALAYPALAAAVREETRSRPVASRATRGDVSRAAPSGGPERSGHERRKAGLRTERGGSRRSLARSSGEAEAVAKSDYGLARIPEEPEPGLGWDYILLDPDTYADPEAELPDCVTPEGADADVTRWRATDALGESLVSTSPPLEFVSVWGPDWDFGTPTGFEQRVDWWFVPVGYTPSDCPHFGLADFSGLPGWVVSGVRPFAAYSIVDTAYLDFESATYETGDRLCIRIKYWVGGIHHFSFYVPIYGSGAVYDYQTFQFEMGDTNYYEKWGEKVWGWTSLTNGTSFALYWQKEGGGPYSKTAEYGPCWGESFTIMVPLVDLCDDFPGYSSDCVDEYERALTTLGYTTNDGLTQPGAWADPSAWYEDGAQLVGEPKHATSLLGNMVRGEVVFFVPPRFADYPELARKGFEMLFGPKVVLKQRLGFVAHSDSGTHTAERAWCITAEDLQSWDSLEDEIIAQRAPGGNSLWIYQNRDIGTINHEVETLARYDCEDLVMWLNIAGGDAISAIEWMLRVT